MDYDDLHYDESDAIDIARYGKVGIKTPDFFKSEKCECGNALHKCQKRAIKRRLRCRKAMSIMFPCSN